MTTLTQPPFAAKGPLLEPAFLRKLERLAIVAKRVQLGSLKGERRSKRKGISIEFADYRDYVQGDDLRHIDWNIYGRLNALHLKLFQDQEDLTVRLLIDSSRSMAFGAPPKIEFAAKVAAAIGYIALAGYDRVGVHAFAENAAVTLPPARGKASTAKLFAFLQSAISTAAGDPPAATSLEQSCRAYLAANPAKGVVVLISDFFDPNGFEGCLRRLSHTGSDIHVIHVLSPDDVDPLVSGDLRLVDSETRGFTEISASPILLRRYKQNVAGFCEGVRSFCLARGITHVFARSDAPFEQLTLEVLRSKGMLSLRGEGQ